MSALRDEVRGLLLAEGFVRAGFASADVPEPEASALDAFLARGDHGEMAWLARSRDVRRDPGHEGMLAGARTVVVAAAPVGGRPIDLEPGRIARYARGRDYHRALTRSLEPARKALSAAGFRTRLAIDSKPLLERAFALRAGLGFIGKNACLIVPGIGSHVVLGCIVTDAVLPVDEPVREGCGACTACLDGCPTSAFRGPRSLDARRCISYLTIELDGDVPDAMVPGVGDWLFGCDACQDVCPYNGGRARDVPPMASLTVGGDRSVDLSAETLLTLDAASYAARFAGSPFARPGHAMVARNAAIVLGNAGSRRHLPVLEAASDDPRPAVARAARDAAQRLRERLETDD